MANIAYLAVQLSANTGKFTKGMRKARAPLQKMQRSVASLKTAMLGLGAALGVGFLVNNIRRSVEAQLDLLDSTGKLADRIGDTTESIVRLRHAAELTGAGTQLLDRSLDVMSKRLGEAAQGSGEAKNALDELGLSASQLLQMRPSQAFTLIADRISMLGSQMEKAAVTSDIFSRAGLKLLNMLDLGAEGLNKMGDEAERLNLTFSRLDASKAEEANDAIYRMKAAFEGIGRVVAVELAPGLERVANHMTSLSESADGTEAIAAAFSSIGRAATYVLDAVSLIRLGFNYFKVAAIGAIEFVSKGLIQLAKLQNNIFTAMEAGINSQLKRFGVSIKIPKSDTAQAEAMVASFEQQRKEAMRVAYALGKQGLAGANLRKALDAAKEKSLERANAEQAVTGEIEKQADILRSLKFGQGKFAYTDFSGAAARAANDAPTKRQSDEQIRILGRIENNTRVPFAVAG